ncbi:hypothetical protein B0H17DRAFT_1141705 [Mycena rosella]|uniref:Uncharacterized protein n=1 Tax=Mycena rosella TaxID=1033263 RepID=A0AAD7CZ67_MYCRO|nr:hypothetical protein B0H17DRAFT_1141705 [Mycena rosella]
MPLRKVKKISGQTACSTPSRRHPVSRHDLNPTQTDQCQKALNEAATHRDILTWSSETNLDRPTVWSWPWWLTQDSQMSQFGASIYNSLPSAEWPLSNALTQTRQQALHTKQEGWHFEAQGHACTFISKIPPLGIRNLTEHGEDSEDENQGHWADSADEEEGFTFMSLDVEAAAKVAELDTETEDQMGSLSWPLPPYSPGGPPAYSSPVSSPIHPSPAKSNQIKPYMSLSKAVDRAAYSRGASGHCEIMATWPKFASFMEFHAKTDFQRWVEDFIS